MEPTSSQWGDNRARGDNGARGDKRVKGDIGAISKRGAITGRKPFLPTQVLGIRFSPRDLTEKNYGDPYLTTSATQKIIIKT